MEKSLEEAKDDMAWYYNQCQTPASQYQVGDQVFLDASDIRTTWPSQKLSHRYLRPYVIQRRVGRHSYRLQLPQSLSHLHPVFNTVKLILALEDPIPGRESQPPPPLELIDGEEHYMVEKVLDSHLI